MKWIREVELDYESSEYGKLQRVKFVTHVLRSEALVWWNIIQDSIEPKFLASLSWEAFKKKVKEKYCNERSL